VTTPDGTLSVETRPARHIVGRIARGRGLQESLLGLAKEHGLRTAWLNAMGAFEWIELTEYNQAERRYEKAHRFERCELLSMQGNLSEREGVPFWHLHATLSVRENGHDKTYGGHVVDGEVFALELRIDCFDELVLRRDHDPATGLQLWTDAFDSAQAAVQAPASSDRHPSATWAMAAEASSLAEPLQAHRPERGDWIEHSKFGLCKIEALSGDGVCIIKLPDARRKKIKIGAMQVLAPRDEGGRKIFPVRSKAKG
jgi:predicted DNA-binding protein with PD1-like motif